MHFYMKERDKDEYEIYLANRQFVGKNEKNWQNKSQDPVSLIFQLVNTHLSYKFE